MTGPEHYMEAQNAVTASTWQRQRWGQKGSGFADDDLAAANWEMARALVHATLALAAATALAAPDLAKPTAVDKDWFDVAAES